MFLSRLGLLNYRNYQKLSLLFTSNLNIFFGDNAQGKTNILEAIYLLATLQTFRAVENKELIYWDKEKASLEGVFNRGDIESRHNIEISFHGKVPKINDKQIKKLADYLTNIYAVCFCPQDLQLIQGSPSVRRRYLDRAILGQDLTYSHLIREYYRILFQRNFALRIGNCEMVEIWGERLLIIGAKVLLKRLQFIGKLNTLTPYLYREISGGNEEIQIRYKTENIADHINVLTETELLYLLKERQKEVFNQERRLKRSLAGPHRDEFSVLISNKDLKMFGSQGEQRTAVLSMKLSEVETLEREKGISPLFLLDDISSELDKTRKEYLFCFLRKKKMQIFMTTTNRRELSIDESKAALFRIERGSVYTN